MVAGVCFVRRAAGTRHGGRAMLNHDELVLGLRQLLPPAVTLKEFPPEGMPLVLAASVWSQARVAICPHGAGCSAQVCWRLRMPAGPRQFLVPPPMSSPPRERRCHLSRDGSGNASGAIFFCRVANFNALGIIEDSCLELHTA